MFQIEMEQTSVLNMIFNNKYWYFVFILILFSCENPTEIDVPRKIDYSYVTKKNISFANDTIDFGYLEKDAFYKKIFKILNLIDKPVDIKKMYFENVPSIFYFDPTLDLNNLIVPYNGTNELNFYLNAKQSIVGEYIDKLYIETDTLYSIVLKSTLPDIYVKDVDTLRLNLGELRKVKINISNYSNYIRKVNEFKVYNDNENFISLVKSPFNPSFIFAKNSISIEININATKTGIYQPRIEFAIQEGIISKNFTNLIIEVL